MNSLTFHNTFYVEIGDKGTKGNETVVVGSLTIVTSHEQVPNKI